MREIGITGGIGSGKSLVASIFESIGYKVYYADVRAKALYREDAAVMDAVKGLFGEDIYLDDGQIDRAKLAGIVFQDQGMLKKLNAIVHPATGRDFVRWRADLTANGYDKPFLLKEAAILYEAGSHKALDGVIEVFAPKETRIKRVIGRDSADRGQVLARMDKQYPELFKLRAADFVIYNDGRHMVSPQVLAAIGYFSMPIP